MRMPMCAVCSWWCVLHGRFAEPGRTVVWSVFIDRPFSFMFLAQLHVSDIHTHTHFLLRTHAL